VADDRWEIMLIAASWSSVVGVVGTTRGMFRSLHDVVVVPWATLAAGVVAVAVALVVAAALARWSRVLREEVRRLGDSGRFDAGFPAMLPTELRALASQLEAISARLAESRTGEERLEESRRVLVSWVSDDLRSPLAALCALSEAREDVLALDPDRYHRQVRAEVDRIVRIVDDLVELSRIPAGAAATDQAG
jgi:signal transduction histidine kinase